MSLERVLILEHSDRRAIGADIAKTINNFGGNLSNKRMRARVADISDAIAADRIFQPQVLLVDMDSLQRLDAMDMAMELRNESDDLRIVFMSDRSNPTFAKDPIMSIISGFTYWLRNPSLHMVEIPKLLLQLFQNLSPIPGRIINEIVTDEAYFSSLTPRQHKAIALMARGMSNSAIGLEMKISPKAVERLIAAASNIMGVPAAAAYNNRRVLSVLEYVRNVQRG